VKTSFASVKATLPAWMQFLPAREQLYHCASQKDSFICKILSVLASLAGVLKYELVPSGLSERSLGTRHIHV
jgi:predicted ATP-grasp superfamily ATP-dependent carboligase